jgi:hypothetical protein
VRTDVGYAFTGDLTGNIVGQDPLLGPLQNNGGGTLSFALRDGSPAIDAGTAEGLDVQDANNVARAHLTLRKDADGTVVVAVDDAGSVGWLLQASSDFQSWEPVGLLHGPSDELKDQNAAAAPLRFYRVLQY